VEDNDFDESKAVLEIYGYADADDTQFTDYWFQLRAIEDGKFLLRWNYLIGFEYYILTPRDGGNSLRDLIGFVSEYFPYYDMPGPKR